MTPMDHVKNSLGRIAEVQGMIVAGALQDAEDMRQRVTEAVDKARAVLAGMPQDGRLTPAEADTIFSSLENLVGDCQTAVSESQEREGETVRLLGKMALREVA